MSDTETLGEILQKLRGAKISFESFVEHLLAAYRAETAGNIEPTVCLEDLMRMNALTFILELRIHALEQELGR